MANPYSYSKSKASLKISNKFLFELEEFSIDSGILANLRKYSKKWNIY